MERYLKIFGVIIIVIGCFLGIRYFGAVIHYTCAIPKEDCPPPINAVGQIGYYLTGGDLLPLWIGGLGDGTIKKAQDNASGF